MCGRYTQFAESQEMGAILAQMGELTLPMPALRPRYNIAPTQLAWVARAAAPNGPQEPGEPLSLQLEQMAFGIHPSFMSHSIINARAETVAHKPMFRQALRSRRCLVLASGFYEWARAPDNTRTPYFFRRTDGRPTVFAGLHRPLDDATRTPPMGDAQEGFVIVTTEANAVVGEHHGRMPVMLEPDAARTWLRGDPNDDVLTELLRPLDPDRLTAQAVSRLVNSPRNDGPELLHAP